MSTEPRALLTPREAAVVLNVGVDAVYYSIRVGYLRPVRRRRQPVMVNAADVVKLLKAKEGKPRRGRKPGAGALSSQGTESNVADQSMQVSAVVRAGL